MHRTVITSLILYATAAHAFAQDDRFWSLGMVTKSCGAFIEAATDEARKRPPNASPTEYYNMEYVGYIVYMQGFISGTNFARSEGRYAGAKSDIPGLSVWLQNYCQAHPLDTFITAVVTLSDELRRTGR